jgi:Kef-type K+ transport system membrane component KefB
MPTIDGLTPQIPADLGYIVTIIGLFILPRILQRFRIPSAVTCVGLGVVLGMGLGVFRDDSTIKTLSTLGIVSMFLFAGLEINLNELRFALRILSQHVGIQLLCTAAATFLLVARFQLQQRPAILVALALFSPSTGFILDSLSSLHLDRVERFWVKTTAVSTEMIALLALFFTVQSTSAGRFLLSLGVMAAMVLLLPLLFKAFASAVLPFAPKTEFAFLVCVALICALITHKLGVYYLIGAFLVGLVAQRFRDMLPAIASGRLIHAIELFAYFFIPFYFFKVGVTLRAENFSWTALLIGTVFVVTVLPLRLGVVGGHRRLVLGEPFKKGFRIGIPILPTLVFSIVITEILRDRFHASPALVGGLVIYALANTSLPSLLLRLPPPEYESPEGTPFGGQESEGEGLSGE